MARSGLLTVAAAVSLVAVVTTLACGTAEPGPRPGYFGRWEVIGFDMPGFHALSAEESQALVGTEAFFSEGEARFGERGCRPPAYVERDVELADFGSEYRLDPALLDLSDPVRVVDVGCAAAWTGPGSILILRADGSLLTVWEGVFFELARVGP
jgi:hypothetical protein